MRISGILIFLLMPLLIHSQDTHVQSNAEQVVGYMFAHIGQYTGWDEKDLNKFGDASAVALTKLLAGQQINADQVKEGLLIISLSFEAPKLIGIDADRQPRTALFVLNYFDSLPVGTELKSEIAATRKRVSESVTPTLTK